MQRPDFRQRNWWLHTTPEMAELERRWKIRNGMNPDNVWQIPGDSSVRNFVAEPELTEEAKKLDEAKGAGERPYARHELKNADLFAQNPDGTINVHLPNLTSAQAVKVAAEKMKALVRKGDLPSIGIAPDDGIPRDFNPETLKVNQGFVDVYAREGVAAEYSMSEEWFRFVNAVAAEVTKEFPDVIVSTNGYANRNLPPFGVELHPNLSVMFAAIWADALHAYDNPRSWEAVRNGQMLKRWCELNSRVWIYGYN